MLTSCSNAKRASTTGSVDATHTAIMEKVTVRHLVNSQSLMQNPSGMGGGLKKA